jgi:FkbM family methyltransferase
MRAGRAALRAWSGHPIAPGYLYKTVEAWGPRLADAPIQTRLFTGASITCDLRDHVQRHIYFFGAYEPVESWLFAALLQPGMTVVDAGANVGQYALIAAAAVGAGGAVHAFEPMPQNFTRAAEHVSRNGFATIKLNPLALWDESRILQLRLAAPLADNAGAYTVGACADAVDVVSCRAVRLDDYADAERLHRVDVIKMDVEGAELHVLRGARTLIARCRPLIFMEVHRAACRGIGYEPEAIGDLLVPYGYKMWALHWTADGCRPLSTLKGVDRANVIFHVTQLPETVLRGWSHKTILQEHRRSVADWGRASRRRLFAAACNRLAGGVRDCGTRRAVRQLTGVARALLPSCVKRYLRRRLLNRIRIGTAANWYMERVVALTLLDVYKRCVTAYTGKEVLRAAIVGYEPHVFGDLEGLHDLGIAVVDHFSWRSERCALAPRGLDELADRSAAYDLLICCASSPAEERQLLVDVDASFAASRAVECRLYPVSTVFGGFRDAFADLHADEFASCLNARKLAAVATALSFAPYEGCVVECGAYKGGTSILLGALSRQWERTQRIHAIDTFVGMPEPTDADGATVYRGGTFAETSCDRVQRNLAAHGLDGVVTVHQGLIQDVLPRVCNEDEGVALALVDTDQYSGTLASLYRIIPLLRTNGIVLVDDYDVRGVRTAIDEIARQYPDLRSGEVTTNLRMLWRHTDEAFLSHRLVTRQSADSHVRGVVA